MNFYLFRDPASDYAVWVVAADIVRARELFGEGWPDYELVDDDQRWTPPADVRAAQAQGAELVRDDN